MFEKFNIDMGMNVHKFLSLLPKQMRNMMIQSMREILDREEKALSADGLETSSEKNEDNAMPENINFISMPGTDIPDNVKQRMEQMDDVMQDIFTQINDSKIYNEAKQIRQQQLLDRIKQDIHEGSGKEWYNYVFPEAENEIKEVIASSHPIAYDAEMLQLALLTSDSFYFLVYIDNNWQLRCKELGDITKNPQYDENKNNETYAMIRKAESFPIKILSEMDMYIFLSKLGLAHNMRYECGYDQIPALVEDALEFAKMRNMNTTRDGVLIYATMLVMIISCMAVFMDLLWMIIYGEHLLDVSQPMTQLYCAICLGFVGAYISLWFRYRSLAEMTYGGPSSLFRQTFSRMLLGGLASVIAFVAVKSGLLFASINSQLGAILLAGFIAGFSERFIPNLFKNNIKE